MTYFKSTLNNCIYTVFKQKVFSRTIIFRHFQATHANIMISFKATIQQNGSAKEKTGWSFIIIPASLAKKLVGNSRQAFRVKGHLDRYGLKQVAVMPLGDGTFMLPVNATMRKGLGKQRGDKIQVELEVEKQKPQLSRDLMAALNDEPEALQFFNTLTPSHRLYFSNWIESAKTRETKTRRIVQSVIALSDKKGYGEMIRENKKKTMPD